MGTSDEQDNREPTPDGESLVVEEPTGNLYEPEPPTEARATPVPLAGSPDQGTSTQPRPQRGKTAVSTDKEDAGSPKGWRQTTKAILIGSAVTLVLAAVAGVYFLGNLAGQIEGVSALRDDVVAMRTSVEGVRNDLTGLSGRLEMLERRLYDHQVLPQSQAHQMYSESDTEPDSTEDEGRGQYRPLIRLDVIPSNSLVDLVTRTVRPIQSDDDVATYHFVTEPEGATITMDRMLLGRAPLTVRFTSDPRPFHIRVGKDGYRAEFQNVVPQGDQTLRISLRHPGTRSRPGSNETPDTEPEPEP